MADVLRSCSKTACRWPAAASLSYRYATRQVWLLDLAPTSDPSLYDLCPHHADALVVPKGWDRVDHRTVQEVMVEPSADDRAELAARRRISAADPGANVRPLVPAGGRGTTGRSRYADLIDQLPRLAAEAGVPGATQPTATITAAPPEHRPVPVAEHPAMAPAPADEPQAPAGEPPAAQTAEIPAPASIASEPPLPPDPPAHHAPAPAARTSPPVPSRDLAPMPPGEPALPVPADEEPLPGQLSIPVDVDDDGRGVVLPFDLAGKRRTPRS